MTKLAELAVICRSKNAGPFLLTLDVVLGDEATYARVRDSNALTAEVIAERYGISVEDVQFTDFPLGNAFKATIPRLHSSGSFEDTDVYGAQQHAPLLDIEIP